ncbi:hypothetical protein TRP8649_03163 [Pelagimonas phthalicica]|uniref:Beta/Gamma crystallin n=1 Tax=Pelagimonas phthalicica TaxID=1037362 RepID=A0A238JF61_9RHOB|nr:MULTISPECIES: hypothetical protein [Roseobacteraceae]MBO9468354.1 hypothetical protein [Tropicibacter sp. R15_0]TDS91983.1 hypothetical protein CLV87_3164 [Pelagimonas phthalicica]SMX29033.1 hypothetical protein TRP8649_03163 [Pelagimonas phthalicica]
MKQILASALSAALISATALPALAAEALSGPEFEAYVKGKTLYFGMAGQAYGVEEYLDDRRVRWSFLDGKCKDGFWYEEASQICFVYEDTPEPQCWSFYKEGKGLRAVFENDPSSTVLYEAQQDDEPMLCLGPDVGV